MTKRLSSIKIQLALGIVLVAIGLGLWWLRLYEASANVVPNTHNAVVWAPAKPNVISGDPVHIDIPSLKLSLQIINGYYDSQSKTWTLTLDKVQYATITPPPNDQSGSTFLYGHYRWGVFATLHVIKPGATAIIKTSNGHTFTYVFTGSRVTDPNDDSVFHYTGAPILTIQTCTGLFFQDRQMFTFKLVKVE